MGEDEPEFDELRALLMEGRAYDLGESPPGMVEGLVQAAERYGEGAGLPLTALFVGATEDGSAGGALVAGLVLAYAIEGEVPARIEPARAREQRVATIPAGFWTALAEAGARFEGPEVSEGTFLVPMGWSVARLLATRDEGAAALYLHAAPVYAASALRLPAEYEARLANDSETTYLDVCHA